jgi:hypothetical protein
MNRWHSAPSSVFDWTLARKTSPVEMCGLNRFASSSAFLGSLRADNQHIRYWFSLVKVGDNRCGMAIVLVRDRANRPVVESGSGGPVASTASW